MADSAIIDNLVGAMARHLEACAAENLKPGTLKLYNGRYRRFLTFLKAEGHQAPFGLDLLNVQNVRRCTVTVHQTSTGARGGESAARAQTTCLKMLSAWLVDEGVLTADGLSRLRRPKIGQPSRQPFSQSDVRLLRAAADELPSGRRDVAIMALLLDTGMRIGELCALRMDDLDLVGRRVVLRSPKGGRDRALFFGSADRRDGGHTLRVLKVYLAQREQQMARAVRRARLNRRAPPPTDAVFLTYDGWPVQAKTYGRQLIRIARDAEMPHVFPHRFRHTFATWYLVRHPGDETGLRGILGHLTDDMYRVYTHLAHEILAQRAGRVSLSETWLGDGDDST